MINWDKKIQITNDKKHVQYLKLAYEYAAQNSPDISTTTAAVIYDLKKKEVISIDSNHFSKGCELTPEEQKDRPKKLKAMIHAEPASIHKAARYGKATDGSIMYMYWVPCNECAKSIVDSGITTLIGHKQMIERTPEDWEPSLDKALDTLKKGGVKVQMYDGKIGGVEHLMRGVTWNP